MALQILACFVLLVCTYSSSFTCGISFNATVSLHGKGDFRRISAAIAAAPNNSNSRFYIHVKPGTYKEHVEVKIYKTFITIIGDNATTTIIVDKRSNVTGWDTADSATVVVRGKNFMAQSITFENSAGPGNKQAVALFNQDTNYTAFYKCVFLGYQDTLFIDGYRLFFKECDIYGTIDFIFGNALAVFQDCKIYVRYQNNIITITAQSKGNEKDPSGFSFQSCSVMASPEPEHGPGKVKNLEVYLGRPWRDYSTVIFMQSFLDSLVNPAGWSAWASGASPKLLFYAEFENRGLGAKLSGRVNWPGFHALNDSRDVMKFTVNNFIDGNTWLPETGIPFRPSL